MFKNLAWDKMNGLLPAIIQDANNGEVLMLGYMNNAALAETQKTGKVTFYSRSKQRLWIKGETSGHYLLLESIEPDCDNDALLILAKPTGPVCHKGTKTCFNSESSFALNTITQLQDIIQQRAQSEQTSSYTKQLVESGIKRIAQKVGEEGVEVALAAASGDKEELLQESADLLYHLLVLLQACDSQLGSVLEVLSKRKEN